MADALPRSAREGTVYLLAGTLSRSVSLLLLPLYSRFLDATEVGAFGVITAFILFLQIVTIGGFDSAASRWYFHVPDPEQRRTTFATWAFHQLVVSSFLCLGMFIAARPLAAALTGDGPQFASSVRLAGLVLVTSTMPNILYNWYRVARRPLAASLAAVGTAAATVTATLLFLVSFDLGTAGAFLAQVCAGVLMTVIAAVLMQNAANPFHMRVGRWKEMMRFALPLVPGGAAFWVIAVADRFMLRALSSVEEAGRYFVVATVASGLALVTYAFQQTWGPVALEMKDRSHAHPTYRRAFLAYIVLGGALIVAVAAGGDIILALAGGSTYSGLLSSLTILTASVVVAGALGIVTIGATIAGTNRPTFEAAVAAALFNTAVNVILIPHYGALGAAWATLGAMCVLVAVGLWRSEREMPVRYPLRRATLIVSTFTAITGLIVLIGDTLGGIAQVLSTLVLLGATSVVVSVFVRDIQGHDYS